VISLPIAGTNDEYLVNPSKIIAVGLNYDDHVAESGDFDDKLASRPLAPVLFAKTPNVLIGDGDQVVLPNFADLSGDKDMRTDLEGELAVIVGARASHVSAADALDFVLGYACFNDVSQRDIQMSDVSGWFRGKSFDTFGPIGPRLVRSSDIEDPNALQLAVRLNGETVQSANTRDMIFDVPTLIAYISEQVTLEPGDIIATGTPNGVTRVRPGDVVEVEIEGIGTLRNSVVLGTERVRA
jgi:2-keto-4-pentenoate hydratase/2-oxohepta-3-ene-1,7-dioic acid hydratase in catechol pathway